MRCLRIHLDSQPLLHGNCSPGQGANQIMVATSMIVLAAVSGGSRPEHADLLLGNWAFSRRRLEGSITFKVNGGYVLLSDRKGRDYVERGKFSFKGNLITLHLQSSAVTVPPPGPPKIGVPFPQHSVPPLHGRIWTLKVKWVDRHHFRGNDGRLYTARMGM